MFCVGPVATITSAGHLLTRAGMGLAHVHRLERLLDKGITTPDGPEAALSPFRGFQTIEFEGATFSYRDAIGDVTFTTGPWNVTLRRGELVFLVGGNGAGKSTTLKLLSGLYTLDAGRMLVDGAPVDREALPQFRELFSAVFADFHLFDRLYGLEDIDPSVVGRCSRAWY